jgi:protein-S-isoprenylcysteine O-methyltransferase Ste14
MKSLRPWKFGIAAAVTFSLWRQPVLTPRIRHPQYAGFVLIMFGFLMQWPTLVTLAMFPVLVTMYTVLARREEAESEATFGDVWRTYASHTPRFFPRFTRTLPAHRETDSG